MAAGKKIGGLFRSETNKVLGGICGGLGTFFNTDPTVIRLIFVLITIFGGSGVLLYIVLWLIIPSETEGGLINEGNIKKNAEEIKVKAREFADSTKDYARIHNTRHLLGIVLLVLGIMFLFENFGFFRFFNIWKLWPAILIILSISILVKRD